MTTYLLITSDKPTELTAFVGPKKPIKKDILNNDEFVFVTDFGEWTKAMETAKASRLPVVNAQDTGFGSSWWINGIKDKENTDLIEFDHFNLDTPVELEGWEPEIVYQAFDDDIKKWIEVTELFYNGPIVCTKRQAYRLKRSEPYLILGAYNSDGNGNVTGGEIKVSDPVKEDKIFIDGDAKTETQESHANEQVEILRFLLGESRLGGWNFGERPLNAGRYWWRTQLRKVFNDILTRRNP